MNRTTYSQVKNFMANTLICNNFTWTFAILRSWSSWIWWRLMIIWLGCKTSTNLVKCLYILNNLLSMKLTFRIYRLTLKTFFRELSLWLISKRLKIKQKKCLSKNGNKNLCLDGKVVSEEFLASNNHKETNRIKKINPIHYIANSAKKHLTMKMCSISTKKAKGISKL